MLLSLSGKINSGKDTVAKLIQIITHPVFTTASNEEIVKAYTDSLWKQVQVSQNNQWEIKKFAAKLKEIASILTGIPVKDFERTEVKDSYLPEYWDRINVQENGLFKTKEDFTEFVKKNDVVPFFEKPIAVGLTFQYTYTWKAKKMTVRELLQKLGTEAVRDKVHTDAWVNALFNDYDKVNLKWIITDTRFVNEAKAIQAKGGLLINVIRIPRLKCEDLITIRNSPFTAKSIFEDVAYNVLEDIEINGKRTITATPVTNQVARQSMIVNPVDIVRYPNYPTHESETALDNYKFDVVIDNNNTLLDLVSEIKQKIITRL